MFTRAFPIELQPERDSEGVHSRILGYGPGMLMMEWRFEKKGFITAMHDHYHEQITYMVKGSSEVTLSDGTKHLIKAGESIYFAPYEAHELVIMEDDSVCIDCFTPIRIDHLERHSIKEVK